MPDTLARRARHIVTENQRVHDTVERSLPVISSTVGALFYASHASMRDDYEVSTPEIDALVELAKADADVYGARLTGGGFGGSVVMLAKAGSGAAVAARILARYEESGDRRGTILLPILLASFGCPPDSLLLRNRSRTDFRQSGTRPPGILAEPKHLFVELVFGERLVDDLARAKSPLSFNSW